MRAALPVLCLLAAAVLAAQTPAAKPPAARPAAPSYKDLKYPTLRPIQIPPVATFTLPNGLRLYLLEDHELPLVSGTALVRTGNLFDPADKVGLATVTGMVMRTGGTRTKTGDQLDVELENIAASVEAGIGESTGSVSFSTLKENTDEVLGVFHDVLTAPEFRQDKIDLAKTQLRSSIARRNDDEHGIAQREFANIVYGRSTPYGWQIEYATVNRIQREDLLGFYRRYFFPANTMLAIRGDFSTAQMKARIEKLFADWTVEQPKVPAFPAVQRESAAGVYLASKNDVTQTAFVVGHLGGMVSDRDFPALEVMADILGGGFSSRLFRKVRTQLGYAYSISADWGADFDHPGLFRISGSTKSASTTDTIQAVQQEIERIRSGEVSESELQIAKDTALNSMVFEFDTKAKTLGRLLTYEYFGYPKDFIQRYQKALAAVSRADVLRVAREHLSPKDLTIVAVGKPEDFGKPLSALGAPVKTLDLTIPEPPSEKAAADPGSLAKGKQLLQRVQEAVGGAAKLAAVRDVVEVIDFRLDQSAGGMKVKQTDQWLEPNHFRQDSEMPFGKISAYSDGQSGWVHTPQGTGPLGAAQLKQVQGDLFRLYFRFLLSDQIPGRTVTAVSDDTLEISDREGHSARLVVNSQTGLPEKVTYESVQMAGTPMAVEDRYADFQEVNGLKVPHKITIERGGRKFADLTVMEYKLNTGLKPEDLKKQP
ncbi:MAG TPA: pitrilysin family protein [Bryobacteraceae bacterium]|nr:pitrilysin family protein [Bryobacteraceae bacterium]